MTRTYPNVAGAAFGLVAAVLLCAARDCAPERDPHEDGFVAPLPKWPAERATVFAPDRCVYAGEKREWATWTGEPQS